jgi:sulfur carrier protein
MVESGSEEPMVKLILRNKEHEVKPGMTLLSALQKINVVPESVIATREGEMILEDEILKDGDVVKLIAVISGGSIIDHGYSNFEDRNPRRQP